MSLLAMFATAAVAQDMSMREATLGSNKWVVTSSTLQTSERFTNQASATATLSLDFKLRQWEPRR